MPYYHSKSNRNKHVKDVHEKPEATFPCNICPKKFVNEIHLKRHQLVHNNEVFKCPFEGCGTSRETKYALNHHYKQSNSES